MLAKTAMEAVLDGRRWNILINHHRKLRQPFVDPNTGKPFR
jgi:hypothetical protein